MNIYIPGDRPNRKPIPLVHPQDRLGTTSIPIDPAKIAGIVITDKPDTDAYLPLPDDNTKAIAAQLIEFLRFEVQKGRLPKILPPLQSGVGVTANAVLHGFLEAGFSSLTMYSEVLQDAVFTLLDEGKMDFASCTSITLSSKVHQEVTDHLERYRSKVVFRPQEISNHPEIVRRLGVIAINAALDVDIYGNVNSTHVLGTHMMNGIGGSGDFARNSLLSIFVTSSLAKAGKISCIVPMVPHVDHCEHDVDIIITEQGLADLRGLAPRERAPLIIEHCSHPDYKDYLRDYFKEACKKGAHTAYPARSLCVLQSLYANRFHAVRKAKEQACLLLNP